MVDYRLELRDGRLY